jgi:hypothetical protein
LFSLSEYGCIENRPRDFGEVEALMSDKMSGVYSGGLMYEYSYEDNKYGIVNLSGKQGQGDVEERDEFDAYKKALENNPAPSGDGGASGSSKSSECPGSSEYWNVDSSIMPQMPKEAEKYMKEGAGKGEGLKGKGSQIAGDSGLSTANVTVDGTSSSKDGDGDSAGAALQGSALVTVMTALVAVLGSSLL